MDVLGKIIAGILAVFVIFMNPLQYLYESQQSIVSSFVESKGTEFVDHICNSGSFTMEQYEQLKEELGQTGELYDIEIEHTHPVTGAEKHAMENSETINCLASLDSHDVSVRRTAAGHVHTDACYLGPYGAHRHNSSCYHTEEGTYCGSWNFQYSTVLYDYTSSSNYCSRCHMHTVGFSSDSTQPSVTGYCSHCGTSVTVNASDSITYKNYMCNNCGATTSWASNSGQPQPSSHYSNGSTTLICTIPEGHYGYGSAVYGLSVCNQTMSHMYGGSFQWLGYCYLDGYVSPLGGLYSGYSSYGYIYYSKYLCTACSTYTYIFAPYMNSVGDPAPYPQYYRVIETTDSNLNINLNPSAYTKNGKFFNNYDWSMDYVDIDLYFKEFDRAAAAAGYTSRLISQTGYASEAIWFYGRLSGHYEDWVFRLNNILPNGNSSGGSVCSHLSFARGECVCNQIIVRITPVSGSQTVKQGEAIDQRAVITYLNGDTQTVTCSTSFTTATVADGQITTLYYYGYANAADVGNNVKSPFSCTAAINVKTPKELSYIQANLSATTINRLDAFPIGSVTLTFTTGETENVYSGWWINGFNNTVGGNQTVTVYYQWGGITKSTTVTIYVRELSSITATMYATTIHKYSPFPITSLTLNYNDGTTETVTSGWSVEGFVNHARGQYNVKVSYTVKEITRDTWVTITVLNLITLCPYCENYYSLNDNDFDEGCPYCSGIIDHLELSESFVTLLKGQNLSVIVTAVYKNGKKEAVTGWTSNYNPNKLGGQLVTISYGGHNVGLHVNVIGMVRCPICGNEYSLRSDGTDPGCPLCATKVVSISATPTDTTATYGEMFQVTVIATYRDGHTAQVSDYTSNYDRYLEGKQNVTIYYQEATTNITVNVVKNLVQCPICNRWYDPGEYPYGCPFCKNEIVSIEASLLYGGTKVQYGSDLKLKILLIYRDGHRVMKYNGYTVDHYEKHTMGNQTVTVHYGGLSCLLHIEVVNSLIKVTCPNGHVYSLNEDGSDPGCPYCSDTTQDNVLSYLNVTYTSEILEKLYADGYYRIPEGDYFTIIVHRRPKEKGLLNTLFHTNVLAPEKKFTYGGEVRS